jgi:hypothetical protein
MRTGKQMTMGIGTVGVVAAAASLLFIIPNYREARAVRSQVSDLQARVSTLETRKRAVDELEHDVLAAREVAASKLKSIPETADVAGLIRRLSDRIDGVNVLEQTFTAGTPGPAIIGEERDSGSVQALPVAADMQATFDAVIALIDNAERMNRLVRVGSVRLMCRRDEPSAGGQSSGKKGTANHSSAPAGSDLTPLLQASIGLEVIYDSGGVTQTP